MSPRIAEITYFPVKGLSGQTLAEVPLDVGVGLPHDRRFAVAHGACTFDPAAPAWRPKTNFLMLMRDEKLATLETEFEPETATLTIRRGGRAVARGRIDQPTGRMLIDQFLNTYMAGAAPPPFKILEAPGHMFSDVSDKVVSLINAASVRDLERVVHAPVNPRRFRGNLLIEDLPAWAEMEWVGQTLAVGTARLKVQKRITRCAATNVNPETAIRDLNIPRALQGGFGHVECGLYARVVQAGRVAVGDGIEPVA